jgi:hypothetical protein
LISQIQLERERERERERESESESERIELQYLTDLQNDIADSDIYI